MCRLVLLAAWLSFSSFSSRLLAAEIWLMSPQLCGGKSYSPTAREAKWKFDQQERAAVAKPEDGALYSSVCVPRDANFVIRLRAKVQGGVCRLILDEQAIELQQLRDQVMLRVGKDEFPVARAERVKTKPETADWILFTIKRQDEKLTIDLDGHLISEVPESHEGIETVGIQAPQGEIRVSHFIMSGQLKRLETDAPDVEE